MIRPLVIAHRGNSISFPENTLPAVASALSLRVPVIELDVHAAADGVAVVIHDRSLARTAGRDDRVDDLKSETLRRIPAPCGHSGEGAAATIPLLSDVLRLVGEQPAVLCLEFKDGAYRDPDRSAAWIVEQFDRYALIGRAVANVASSAAATALKRRDPRIRVVLDVEERVDDEAAARTLVTALSSACCDIAEWRHDRVTFEAVAACHAVGMPVWAWTANDGPSWNRLIACGVDAILTDEPAALQRHLRP